MSGPVQRAYELTGPGAAAALDWLHVHAEVLGVVEEDERIVVWIEGSLPELPIHVGVRELPVDPAAAACTGLEHDAPIRVADDLLVRPPWVDRPADFRGVELVVPRGAAFGSGEHGSTQAALRCLHALWDGSPSLVDVGTGSGILALYAAVRGCRRLAGCDIDLPSVRAARELLPSAQFVHGGPDRLEPAAAVVANMTGDELTAAMPEILRLWTGAGPLVLGGLRAHEVEPVARLVGLPPAHRETVGDFTSLGFRRTAGQSDRT